jgi:multidrug efflux pump subunit AcrA (membrane-fusion protein)
MRFLGRSLTGLLLLMVTLALLGAAAIVVGSAIRESLAPGEPSRPAEERVVAANLVTLEPVEVTPRVTAYGKVEARRTLDLRLPQGGTVIWVSENLRDGGEVTEGARLLALDPVAAEDAVKLAQADLTEAEGAAAAALVAVGLAEEDLAAAAAQTALRQQALERQIDIDAQGAGSPQAVETAELAVSTSRQAEVSRRQALAQARERVDQTAVTVTRARLALAEAERRLADSVLYAGIGGRVEGVTVVPGAVVTANEGLGRIVDPASLEVALRLSTAQYSRLLDDGGELMTSPVTITLPGHTAAATIPGQLERVGASVGEGQTGRLVFATLDPAAPGQALLKPGDFVEVAIEGASLPDAAVVPATAIGRQGTVLALGPGDRLEEVAVELLARQGDEVVIAVGPLAGREIVAERSAFLGAGIRVRPNRHGPAEGTDPPADG